MEIGYACPIDTGKRLLKAASLMDSGDVLATLSSMDGQLVDWCRAAVFDLASVLSQAGLITDESLLNCDKRFLKAAIKLSILASFAAGRREDEKILASLYCQLAQFQDVSETGFLVFDGSEEFLEDVDSGPDNGSRNAQRARALRLVADELQASRREMSQLSSRLEQLRAALHPKSRSVPGTEEAQAGPARQRRTAGQ